MANLFYDSIIPAIPGCILYIPVRKVLTEKRKQKKIYLLKQEFASMLDSLAGALASGYSIPNSFLEAREDIRKLYGDKSCMFIQLGSLISGIKLNRNFDDTIVEFGKKVELDEAQYFCNVICVTRKEGGNLIEVIKNIRNEIYEKIELQRQIEISVASKKYEALVMGVMPIGITLYLRVFSKGFLDEMYHNPKGIIIMSVILICYSVLIMYINKVIEIEI